MTFADRIMNSPIGQKLIARASFIARDTATGIFTADNPYDHWRIDRTTRWCDLYCKRLWRRTLRMATGVVTFEFEDADDAAIFKRVTGRAPTLINCR
jgi:hypothetical protein